MLTVIPTLDTRSHPPLFEILPLARKLEVLLVTHSAKNGQTTPTGQFVASWIFRVWELVKMKIRNRSVVDTTLAKQLIDKAAALDPSLDSRQMFRVCHLLCNSLDEPGLEVFEDDQHLADLWSEISLRLQAASDQHAAVTEELDTLAASDPSKFSPDQVWTLVKTIKVLNQILRLYTRS